jgi:uncharacterized protein
MHDSTRRRGAESSSAASRPLAARSVQLLLGLLGWGVGITLFIRSRLGLGPWDAFHYGIHVQTGITVGMASILAGFCILLVTLAMAVRPGVATVLNMVLIGVFIDLLMPLIPDAPNRVAALAYFAAAIPLVGLSSGLYIGAGFGHGPRDGLMVAIVRRSGWSVRRVRTVIEVSVLGAGWAMGGTVGLGTVIVAATIGPAVQWGLRLFGALPDPAPGPAAGHRPGGEKRRRRLRKAA